LSVELNRTEQEAFNSNPLNVSAEALNLGVKTFRILNASLGDIFLVFIDEIFEVIGYVIRGFSHRNLKNCLLL